jgi:succinate dehydrogenase/fumarate reductase flavoprotein subunit
MPDSTTATCDVLVIGGGGAGLAASIEAANNGARVILVEKNPELGGTTAWSIGSFTATQTPQQLASGIQDSPDEHFIDMPKFAGPLADRDNPALRRLFVDNASDTLRWLMDLGVEFFGPMPEPPHEKPRMHNVLPNSRAYIYHVGRHAKRIGVDIRTSTQARKFTLERGRVIGAECETADGSTLTIQAGATILASGDYAANQELKAKYISPEVSLVDAMNPTATGDGHIMAFPLGARVINGDVLSGPTLRFVPPPKEPLDRLLPPFRIVGKAMRFALKYFPASVLHPMILKFTTTSMAPELSLFAKGALLVNQEGDRIDGAPGTLGLKIAQQPGKTGYVIMDSVLAQTFSAWPNFISTAPGVSYAYFDDFRKCRPDIFHKAESLDALADSIGVDAGALQQSIDAHNGEGQKIGAAPFYALGPAKSYVVLTDGGLAVSDDLHVLGENDAPIDGLYAAGSAGQGGLMLKGHGHHIGWAFTSGRLAGGYAAADAKGVAPAKASATA